ncbi:hypothetical protein DRO19_00990 [Candidatus Bathyarchaeota archaeon]|mgnify:CR=1 FL=1|nr:MAG: hypothetical protein DRO19_00990 [Candidatus Bathyarchaeota archaeon]
MEDEKLQIGNITLLFKFRKNCEETGKEIKKVIEKYKASVLYALITCFGSAPKKFEVIVKRSSQPWYGRFRIMGNRIVLNAQVFEELKEEVLLTAERNRLPKEEFLENAYNEWMFTFLHELAHWLTPDESKADNYASEWLNAT